MNMQPDYNIYFICSLTFIEYLNVLFAIYTVYKYIPFKLLLQCLQFLLNKDYSNCLRSFIYHFMFVIRKNIKNRKK